MFPGPYRCYYNLPTPDLLNQAYELIRQAAEEEGPFDGVIGFSQGAALAASIMLQHAKSNPREELFRCAIFAGASLPYNLDDSARSPLHEVGRVEVIFPAATQDDTEPRGFPTILGPIFEPFLGRYHPEIEKAKISVPTLHIIGDLDQYASQSRLLSKLCDTEAKIIYHPEGHRIPRDPPFQKKVAIAIEGLIHQSLFRYG